MLSREFIVLNLALAGMVSMEVQADDLDTLQFRAGQSVQHDNNIFRLSDTVSSQAILGTSRRSDTVAVTTVGAKIDKPYGLQRFELDVNASRYNYRNFSNLDFTAVNYAAAWRWSFTPSLHGNLTTDRKEYTDNTADVQNMGELNRRTDRFTLLDAEYEIDGPWRVLGGVFERKNTNSQPFTFEGDTIVRGVEAGVRYVFASDTSLAYRLKQGNGEYPDRPASLVFASDFKDREHEFRLDWPITGKTTLQSRLSHFDRAHDALSGRDFSGFTGQLNATWQPTGKTTVRGGVARDLGSYQAIYASYYEGNRLFLAPTWKPTEKTAVQLRYDHGKRNYKGPLPGALAIRRRDTTNLASLAFEWQAIRALKVTASVFSDRRKSNTPGFDYKSNGFNVAVVATF